MTRRNTTGAAPIVAATEAPTSTDTPVVADAATDAAPRDWSTVTPDAIAAEYAAADVRGKASIRSALATEFEAASSAVFAAATDSATVADVPRLAAIGTHIAALREAIMSVSSSRPTKSGPSTDELIARLVNRVAFHRLVADEMVRSAKHLLPADADVSTLPEKVRVAMAPGYGTDGAEHPDDGRLSVTVARAVADAVAAPLSATARAPRQTGAVETHLAEWRASVPVGTFATVAQLAAFQSSVYGAHRTSALDGRIAVRLFPTDGDVTLDLHAMGIATVEKHGSTARGVRAIEMPADDGNDS